MNPDFSKNIPQSEAPKRSFRAEAWETIRFILIALAIVIPIRLYIAQPFIVSGASMDPTFANGQYLIVDEISYRVNDPVRGDVVIFKYPKNPKQYFIKRVIGLPGETVRIEGKNIYIENEEHQSGYLIDEPYLEEENVQASSMSITLSPTDYFVLGDNRRASSDSRVWGPLGEKYIVGRAFLRLLPLSDSEILPGSYPLE